MGCGIAKYTRDGSGGTVSQIGPVGPPGTQGATGPKGDKGDQGNTGVQGPGSVDNLTQVPTRNFSDLQGKPTTVTGYGITDAQNVTDLTQIPTRNFSDLQSKPTTMTGYGITDGQNITNLTQVPTRNFSDLQSKPTTMAGYGLTDVQSKLKEFRVSDYGAIGNGTTDDSAAIQSAIVAAVAVGGGNVVFDARPYLISTGSGNTGYSIPDSGQNHVLFVTGGSTTTRLNLMGRGARLISNNTSATPAALVGIYSPFNTITFDGFTFDRGNAVTTSGRGEGIYAYAYDTSAADLIAIRNCRFINLHAAIHIDGNTSNPYIIGKIAKLEVRNSKFEYPWGSNTSYNGSYPSVGILNSWWADTTILDGNDFDGGGDVSSNTNTPLHTPMHGFIYSESRKDVFSNNTLKNFYIEGLYALAHTVIAYTNGTFTLPAVGADVTVAYLDFPAKTYFAVGMTLSVRSSSNSYLAAQMTVQSIDTTANTLVLRNTGASGNAVAGTVIGATSQIGVVGIVPDSQTHVFNNDIDQGQTIDGPTPANPAITLQNEGPAFVTNNIVRNAIWGICLGNAGAVERIARPTYGDNSLISGNQIGMRAFSSNVLRSIGLYDGVKNTTIQNNVITAPSQNGLIGIQLLGSNNNKVLRNTIKATNKATLNSSYVGIGFQHGNATTGNSFSGNTLENLDYGAGGQGTGGTAGATTWTLGQNTYSGVTRQGYGNPPTTVSNLISPADVTIGALRINGATTANSGASGSYKFADSSYVVQSGDSVIFDVYIGETTVIGAGAIRSSLLFTDASYTSNDPDQFGISALGSLDQGSMFRGRWGTREFNLTAYAGKTVSFCRVGLGNGSTATGAFDIYFRNIRIVNSSGVAKKVYYSGTEVPVFDSSANVTGLSVATNYKVPVVGTTAGTVAAGDDSRFTTSGNASTPIIVSVKSATVLTAGAPSDIATIPIPSFITRWYSAQAGNGVSYGSVIYAETASGTLAGASFLIYTGAGATGAQITTAALGPTAAGGTVTIGVPAAIVGTASTLYLRQTANSVNAGTVSVYLVLYPIP